MQKEDRVTILSQRFLRGLSDAFAPFLVKSFLPQRTQSARKDRKEVLRPLEWVGLRERG
jgi:hypothetical protein